MNRASLIFVALVFLAAAAILVHDKAAAKGAVIIEGKLIEHVFASFDTVAANGGLIEQAGYKPK